MNAAAQPGLEGAIATYLDYLRVERGLSPATIAAYGNDLRGFVRAAANNAHDWRTTDADETNKRRLRAQQESFAITNQDARHPATFVTWFLRCSTEII